MPDPENPKFANPRHVDLRRTPHPVIVTIRDNRDYIRVLLYSYYTTITGWGVLLMYIPCPKLLRSLGCRAYGLGLCNLKGPCTQ